MTNKHGTQPKPPEIKNIPPLVKWAGGKRNVVNFILPLLPPCFNHYFEPFLGGGALFFALQPPVAYLSDRNAELINAYSQVREYPAAVIRELSKLPNSEKDYYKIRASKPRTGSARAARLIYLVTLAFNGIYRVNLKGQFNVPYGWKSHLPTCDPEHLKRCSKMLASAEISHGDFEAAVTHAKKGDLVYLDPPYTVAHGNNGFVKYNAKIFSWEDQIRLAKVAHDLVKRKCRVIVSNAHHSSILKLYSDFNLRIIERESVIAASSMFRRRIHECIFYSWC
jgi:DNA adenine methylase